MTNNQKILAAVLALITALVGALVEFGGALTPLLGGSGQAGASAPVAGKSGQGGVGGLGGAVAGRSGAGGSAGSIGPGTGGSWLSAQEWFVDPSWSGVKIFSSPGIISPTWVSEVKSVGARYFRHMDTNATNNSKQVNWSTRRLPSDPDQTAYGAPDGSGGPGVALEYQVDMCNALGSGCWFNIPHQADDDYVAQFATLVSKRLNSSLPVIVEYSNETWNGQFSQFGYVNQQGVAGKLPGSNQYYQGGAYAVYRSLQIGKIFKSIVSRTQLVFAFSGNYDIAVKALNNVYKSAQWNPSNVKIDLLAVAPYVGTNGNNGAGFSLTAWKTEVDGLVSGDLAQARRIANNAGISALGFYEFGSTYYSNAFAFTNNPDAQAAYEYMLGKFLPLVNAPACHYTAHSTCSSGSCWGAFTPDVNAKGKALQSFR